MIAVLADGLDPSNEQSREWARDELSKDRYHPAPPERTILDEIGDWFSRNFDWFGNIGKHLPLILAIIIGLAVLALIVVALRYVRRSPRKTTRERAEPVLGGEPLAATELRRRAERAMAAEDYDGCVREAMRALTRRSAERALLVDAPSLTAGEVAHRLSRQFSAYRNDLFAAATLFDSVMYGGRHADAAGAAALLDLESTVADTRPDRDATAHDAGFAVPR